MRAGEALAVERIECVDGEREACFDLRAFCAIEKETGKDIFSYFGKGAVGISDLMILVWAALLRGEPTLKLDDISDLMTPALLLKSQPTIQKLIEQALGTSTTAEGEDSEKK